MDQKVSELKAALNNQAACLDKATERIKYLSQFEQRWLNQVYLNSIQLIDIVSAEEYINSLERALELCQSALDSCSEGDYSTGHVIDPSFDEKAVNDALHEIDVVKRGKYVPIRIPLESNKG